MTFFAYTDRRGVITIAAHAPYGMLVLASHSDCALLGEVIKATARHAYDGVTLLVPGVPEAIDDDAAVDAVIAFRDWIAPRLEGRL